MTKIKWWPNGDQILPLKKYVTMVRSGQLRSKKPFGHDQSRDLTTSTNGQVMPNSDTQCHTRSIWVNRQYPGVFHYWYFFECKKVKLKKWRKKFWNCWRHFRDMGPNVPKKFFCEKSRAQITYFGLKREKNFWGKNFFGRGPDLEKILKFKKNFQKFF